MASDRGPWSSPPPRQPPSRPTQTSDDHTVNGGLVARELRYKSTVELESVRCLAASQSRPAGSD